MTKFESRFHDSYEPVTETGCWLWNKGRTATNRKGSGYGTFWAGYEFNKGRQVPAHRYSYFLKTGHIPTSDEHVMHKCDTGICVNPDHLQLGNHMENMQDKTKKGRGVYPIKLSAEQAQEARKLRASGMQVKDIAAIFGMSSSHMSRITSYDYRKLEQNFNNGE